MIYKVHHSTRLTYAAPVAHARYKLRLEPATWPGQTMRNFRLSMNPRTAHQEVLAGPYWVVTTSIAFPRPLQSLELTSEFEMEVEPPLEPGDGPGIDDLRDEALSIRDLSPLAPAPYLFASRIAAANSEIARWGEQWIMHGKGVVGSVRSLMSAIHREFDYVPGATTSLTPPAEAFHARKGVCQDFAHVMIMALRAQGVPAAYASGYLRTVPPPGQERLVGADAMHAWVNVWCGSAIGWVGFDPTNDCLAQGDHIQIGMGRDYADVSPIDGTFIGNAPQSMATSVDVFALDKLTD